MFGTRKKEHQKECEKETAGALTRASKQKATEENLKSAISDHCKRENHLMDWDKAKVIHRESNRFQRWIREAVEIRKRAPKTMNRDDGAYTLAHTWDVVLTKRPPRARRTQEGAPLPHSEGERHPSRGMTRPPPFHQTAEGPAPPP